MFIENMKILSNEKKCSPVVIRIKLEKKEKKKFLKLDQNTFSCKIYFRIASHPEFI